MQQRATDKRGGNRVRMLKGGTIAFSGRHATMPCVVRDASEGGARLQVAQASAVPDTFELLVELDGLEVPCQVIWRRLNEIGVAFLDQPTRSAPKRVQVIRHTGPQGRHTLRRTPPTPLAEPPGRPHAHAPAQPAPASPLAEHPAAPSPGKAAPATQTSLAPSGEFPLLIAEDDPDDRLLMQDAFTEAGFKHPIAFVENGVELLRYVRGEAPYEKRAFPRLILLDLNMPKMDGRTALMHLKTEPAYKRIPVIVLTTSNAEDDIHRTYELGVTAYVSKPGTHAGLLDLVTSLDSFWSRFVSLPTA